MYKYTIPEIPPSANKYLGRNNRFEYSDIKGEWEWRVKLAVHNGEKPAKPLKRARVTITYHFPDNRRRDPDNYAGKFLLDGLVRASVLEDDSFRNVDLQLRAVFGAEKKTEITVKEL